MASTHKLKFIDAQLRDQRQAGLYRRLQYTVTKGSKITINKKSLVNLCSNDYLGMPTTKVQTGQLQSSSRLIAGNDESYHRLENALARHKSQQSSLVYPTGYMANLGVISAIAKKGDIICSDELNHASIIEAVKLSDARVIIYRHNDTDDLERKLRQRANNKFVITEGVFSMDGDLSQLGEITEIAQKRGAITILDDAHGDFVLGRDGRGTPSHLRVAKKIDLYISSLSKGLGSFGGYVASPSNVTELCINKAKSFVYTSALPSFMIEHAFKRLQYRREKYRKKLQRNSSMLKNGLGQIGYDIRSATQIIPIMIGDEKKAVRFGEFLFERGIFVRPIRYPTVPRNQARLRISVTAWLTEADIAKTLRVFEKAYKRFC